MGSRRVWVFFSIVIIAYVGLVAAVVLSDDNSASVVRVRTEDPRGGSLGTGCYLGSDGRSGWVLTAKHVCAHATHIWVDHPGGGTEAADRLVRCTDHDQALLRVRPIEIPAAKLATREPRIGDTLRAYGFDRGDGRQLRTFTVTVTKPLWNNPGEIFRRLPPSQYEATGTAAISGNSGGPVFFNDSGELVANLWGSPVVRDLWGRRIGSPGLTVISNDGTWKFIRQVAQRYQTIPACEGIRHGFEFGPQACPIPTLPPTPSAPPIPAAPPATGGVGQNVPTPRNLTHEPVHNVHVKIDYELLVDVMKKHADAFRGVAGPEGPPGTDGTNGTNGTDGKNGDDGRGVDRIYLAGDGKIRIVYSDGVEAVLCSREELCGQGCQCQPPPTDPPPTDPPPTDPPPTDPPPADPPPADDDAPTAGGVPAYFSIEPRRER